MNFDEKIILTCLERLAKKEITKELAYNELKGFTLNTLKENGYKLNRLNIGYASHLIAAKIFGKKDDFGYEKKLNSSKVKFVINSHDFSIDECLCRSISIMLFDLKYGKTLKVEVLEGARILDDYLVTFDYFKKDIDIIE